MKTTIKKARGSIWVLAAISMSMLILSPVRAGQVHRISTKASILTSEAGIREWNEIENAQNAATYRRVPFKARLAGSAAFTSPTTVDFHGTGQATHLGRFVADGIAVLGESTGSCPGGIPNVPNVHTETLTAANGDELVIRMVNIGCPTGPYTFRGTGQWTVLSGTGRFENVTGEGTNEGNADFERNRFELTLTGAISSP